MTEAPDHIFLLPKDAALFGQKYGHPDVQQVHVGDESVQYVRKDVADLARPVTVVEAANNLAKRAEEYAEAIKAHDGITADHGGAYGPKSTAYRAACMKFMWLEIALEKFRALSHEGGE